MRLTAEQRTQILGLRGKMTTRAAAAACGVSLTCVRRTWAGKPTPRARHDSPPDPGVKAGFGLEVAQLAQPKQPELALTPPIVPPAERAAWRYVGPNDGQYCRAGHRSPNPALNRALRERFLELAEDLVSDLARGFDLKREHVKEILGDMLSELPRRPRETLTEEDRERIVYAVQEGHPRKDIAENFRVSVGRIGQIMAEFGLSKTIRKGVRKERTIK